MSSVSAAATTRAKREIPKPKISTRTKGCESCSAQQATKSTSTAKESAMAENQAEQERRRHIERLRLRENERRQQVEERKRALEAAEQEKRARLLKKTAERDLKVCEKRRECLNSSSFAFGSSTPRLISNTNNAADDVADSTPTMRRRAASISNGESSKNARNNLMKTKPKPRANSISSADDVTAQQKMIENSTSETPTLRKTPKLMTSSLIKKSTHSSTSLMTSSLIEKSTQSSLSSPKPLMTSSLIKRPTQTSSTPATSSSTTATPLRRTASLRQTPARRSSNNLMSSSFTSKASSSPPQSTSTPVTTSRQRSASTKLMSTSLIVSGSKSNHSQLLPGSPCVATSSRIPKAISSTPLAMSKSAKKPECKQQQLSLNNSLMTASFIARSKITTEEQAVAALAEQRRIKREEAERQAQENFALELAREQAENERQRRFVEESVRLVEEHQRATAESLCEALKAAKIQTSNITTATTNTTATATETTTTRRRDSALHESKAQKDAEIMRKLEAAAERLRLEERERKERRKRVEEIMSRMRKGSTSGGSDAASNAGSGSDESSDNFNAKTNEQQQQANGDISCSHAKYNVNSTGILIVRESNFNFLRS